MFIIPFCEYFTIYPFCCWWDIWVVLNNVAVKILECLFWCPHGYISDGYVMGWDHVTSMLLRGRNSVHRQSLCKHRIERSFLVKTLQRLWSGLTQEKKKQQLLHCVEVSISVGGIVSTLPLRYLSFSQLASPVPPGFQGCLSSLKWPWDAVLICRMFSLPLWLFFF